ncbi:GntR family transcriptional regulator [Acuticoccus mangrovi]|uniref:GntR family transcriptional regulator n=1 Tax=Acuticoccus mangrovi TaxID=2796142 RepID=A0A934INX0_9HYPH|nr:GntR family transcriptional regulator [Acuticoccus mangrovi]MBJ3774879.1 GntR family transcriptional regulator [Acuticoccus mangrovi]
MNVSDTVHLKLKRRLMAGYYEPGAPLKEDAVANDLGVSRTPVRAAIQRLISEGLLEPAPKRGAVVTEWRREDAEDIFNLRILLEGYSASLAAQNISDEGIEELAAINARMAEAAEGKAEGFRDVVHLSNKAFHEGLLAACGSAHLRKFSTGLLEYPMVLGGFYIYNDDDMAESIRQHAEIIAGVRARNSEWARAAMTCHLTAAIERFRRAHANEKRISLPPELMRAMALD